MEPKVTNLSADEPYMRFKPSPSRSVGVELEVSLVDPETRQLTPRAPDVLAEFKGSNYYKPELYKTIIEINTDVCNDVGEVRADLQGKLDALHQVCDRLGLVAMSTGTHPFSKAEEQAITDKDRYQHLANAMQWPARRLLICGQHVHVGVPSGEHAVALVNALRCFIPHLLSVSASSPFWKGRATGLASSRIKIFEGLPTAGLPPHLTNWNEFSTLMRTLIRAGAIKSIQEIWWDIRPHPGFGTVEIRIADSVNTMDEVCALTAFIQCLAEYFCELYDAGEEIPVFKRWTIRENKWRAARYGDDMTFIRNEQGDQVPIREHIMQCVEALGPIAERLNCVEDLQYILKILEVRPSFARQRAYYQETGSLEGLVDGLTAEFRNNKPMGT